MTQPRDEMVDGHGGVRPHWRALLAAFHDLGEGGLQERARRLDRAMDEDGIGTLLPGATNEARPWRCDPIPVLLQAAEFEQLEAALTQRAELLSRILSDLYGPQTLLSEGHLPALPVLASPGFLRPLHTPGEPAAAPQLTQYAADLVRGPDGAWQVLADRTSVIEGIGAARENRRMLARVMPEAFRPLQVRHQRGFFDRWRDSAVRGLPDNPGIALLTPGIGNPHWFEHVVLARELSCTLVETGDLTVRNGRLFLKTLHSLQPIDVLLRQVEGRAIDSLELDHGGGVPGLLDAARDGGVLIQNAPGSALAAAPVVAAHLPDLARTMLGGELALPQVECLWLGAPAHLRRVEQAPGHWLLRPASDEHAPPAGADSSDLLTRVRARPWEWVAVARGDVGSIPCVGPAGMEPGPLVMRLFLVFNGEEWCALRGGLGQVAERETGLAGLPTPRVTKDVWVLAEDRTDILGPGAVPAPTLKMRRSSGDLPSRVADNLFWLGRYVERAERAARLVRAATGRLASADSLTPRQRAGLDRLAACLMEAGLVPDDAVGAQAVREGLLGAVRPRGKLPAIFAEITRLTESVRDRLTDDMYATFVQSLAAARSEAERARGPRRTWERHGHRAAVLHRGLRGRGREHGPRRRLPVPLDLGRRLERARAVIADVAVALDQPPPHIEGGLAMILELCDSAITYRSRYLNVVQPAAVLDLVLVDQGNPRGLAFQLVAMHDHLDELNPGGFGREALAGATAGVLAEAEALVATLLAASDQPAAASALPPQLRTLSAELAALSDRIVRRYFSLLPAAQSLGWAELEGAA